VYEDGETIMPRITLSNTIRFLIILVLLLTAIPRSASADEAVAKVVYHADSSDPKRFSAMIQNIFNMTTTYENSMTDYDIRIVLLSRGIRFVTRDDLKGTLFEADKAFINSAKISLNACHHYRISGALSWSSAILHAS